MRFILRISTLLLVLLAHVASLCLPQQSVAIKNGTLVGSIDPTNKAQRFLGIPYAQPPVGRFRLRQAVALNSTFGTLNATKFGFDCYGTGWNPNPSEDCLTLNIWRSYDPSQGSCDKVPVMVWFYGGGLTNGYTVS